MTIFVHAQKTGGTTLRQILFTEYGPAGMLNLDFVLGEDQLAAYQASDEQRGRVRAIAGHIAFGLHAELGRSGRYITMLREPVRRVVSHYDYARRNERTREAMEGVTLHDFVTSEEIGPRNHNVQTRVLGNSRLDPERVATRETLDAAKRNLGQHFAVAGLTERFDESVLLMRRALDWPVWPFYERRNVAPEQRQLTDLPPSVLTYVTESNDLDAELYRWAAGRFDEMVEDAGARFRSEVAIFRMLNVASVQRLRSTAVKQRSRVARLPRRLGRALTGR